MNINIGSNSVANNVTQMVAGVLSGLTIDLGFILEVYYIISDLLA